VIFNGLRAAVQGEQAGHYDRRHNEDDKGIDQKGSQRGSPLRRGERLKKSASHAIISLCPLDRLRTAITERSTTKTQQAVEGVTRCLGQGFHGIRPFEPHDKKPSGHAALVTILLAGPGVQISRIRPFGSPLPQSRRKELRTMFALQIDQPIAFQSGLQALARAQGVYSSSCISDSSEEDW
jgi:hypothetical protein